MISKEQWKEIKEALNGSYGLVKFKLNGKEVTLEKRFIKENVLAICVFIDGQLQPAMGYPGNHFDPIVEQLWNKRSRSAYTAKQKQSWIKIYGKRRVKKEVEDLDKKIEWYEPFFKTFASMQRKYKKVDGLEFVKTTFAI